MLKKKITELIKNRKDAWANIELGLEYYRNSQYAGAFTFLLRGAELSQVKEEKYSCLLSLASCYGKIGGRPDAEENLCFHAISVIPDRPEAYTYLSTIYETKGDYIKSYGFSSLALSCEKNKNKTLPFLVENISKEDALFEKSVSSWWIDKVEESRELSYLVNTNASSSNKIRELSNNNIRKIGLPQKYFGYSREKLERYKFPFEGIETIDHNYAEIMQDMFVLSLFNGKRNGTYLEIGANDPIVRNNTYLLESKFDWKGISIDYDNKYYHLFEEKRENTFIVSDALSIDYKQMVEQFGFNDFIDYLQIDIDGETDESLKLINLIPFDSVKFGVITFEHDAYIKGEEVKNKSRKFFKEKGYLLIAPDVGQFENRCFEDWWVNPDIIHKDIIKKMKNSLPNTPINSYMFSVG